MISMKDIAKRCGVSVATVSKALNGHTDISDETKRMVREMCREMGYLPNSSARALKTKRTYNLGVLFIDEAQNGLTHDYFARVLDAFKVEAESKGYDITFINSSRTNRTMTYLEHSRYRGVDGVVIACVNFESQEVLDLVRSSLPVVTIDHSFDSKPCVMSDNIEGMRTLVSYILSQGHRRVAYINGGDGSSVTRNRIGSFHRTMAEHGIEVPDAYMRQGIYRDPDSCYRQTEELLDMEEPPTCIIYPDDLAAIGGINAIKDRGLSIPDDVSIAGYDGLNIAKMLSPKFTTIEQDARTIGRLAAEKLIGMIERPKSTVVERIVVQGKLLPGDSVKNILPGEGE